MSRSRTWLTVLLVAIVGSPSRATAMALHEPLGAERLLDGNTLITDAGNFFGNLDARVIEVDSLGRLVWAYLGCDVPYAHTGRRLASGNTLITSSIGDKVVEVDRVGNTVWTMASGLVWPNEAYRLANGNTLITCRDNSRILEVTPRREIAWSYFNVVGPHNASRLATGNTLISDSEGDRVIEVDSAGNLVWQYASGLNWPRSAQRLDNDNTLIADTRNNRAIEVTRSGTIVWSVTGVVEPFTAIRLANDNTLLSGPSGVAEVTPEDSVVWQYPNTVPVVVETLRVVNPTSGCSLYVHIHRPAYAGPDSRVPGVVFGPGGIGYGSSFDFPFTMPDDIASDGFAFLHFDPDGRGQSGSYPENYDGYVHQDGMHACLSLLASRDYVDTSQLGVFTQGYGITMASGMIARYAEPRVKFLLDFEGPADRYQTCLDSGGFVPVPSDSDAFWLEREAGRFMKQVPGAYLRMQPQVDSNPRLRDGRHAIQLIDSATSAAHGGAGIGAWTRVNDSVMNPANRVYTLADPPVWIPQLQELQNRVRILLYLHELARNPLGVDDRRVDDPAASLQAMPRPCRGALQVGLPSGPGGRDLRVHDVCGRLVARTVVRAGDSQATLDLRHLQSGVYYVSAAGAGTVPVVVVR